MNQERGHSFIFTKRGVAEIGTSGLHVAVTVGGGLQEAGGFGVGSDSNFINVSRALLYFRPIKVVGSSGHRD